MTVTCRTATLFLRPEIFSPTGERAYPLTARLLIECEAFKVTATVLFAPTIGQLLSATSTPYTYAGCGLLLACKSKRQLALSLLRRSWSLRDCALAQSEFRSD